VVTKMMEFESETSDAGRGISCTLPCFHVDQGSFRSPCLEVTLRWRYWSKD
jgi:hypothetical protein